MHLPIILATVLALGLIEAVSWWWMHSAPTDQVDPVLTYQHRIADEKPSAQSSPSNQQSTIFSTNFTLLPELVSRSVPLLRCSTGTAARIDRADGVVVHVAFFEWDLAASGNVLEAFKHLPEECMGAIGMTLIKIHPPRTYSSLSFDHTEFRDPAGRPIHAFKGVWVSGAKDFLGDEARSGGEQWRQIRLKAALKRFRPAHARVAQGAVHGIVHPDRAWEIFEESMLNDLRFE